MFDKPRCYILIIRATASCTLVIVVWIIRGPAGVIWQGFKIVRCSANNRALNC
jgi:hypothetical protein